MCHLIRDAREPAGDPGKSVVPSPGDRLRQRWIGAGAAVLMTGLAVAALLAPPPSSAPENETRTVAAAAPFTASATATPAASFVQLQPTLVDDDVPSAATNKAAADSCHHGL